MPAKLTAFLFATLLLGACATERALIRAPGDLPVYVVTHGWHTGLAVRTADIDFSRWEPLPHLPTRYLEVGWGDRDFYPAPAFNLWYALKALFWPTPAVLHVVGFDEPPAQRFPGSEVVELRIARPAFEDLLAYIASSFVENPQPVASSLYARGAFYPSRESFHLFRMCNAWVAQALRHAQVEVDPALLPEGLLAQLRPYSSRDFCSSPG